MGLRLAHVNKAAGISRSELIRLAGKFACKGFYRVEL